MGKYGKIWVTKNPAKQQKQNNKQTEKKNNNNKTKRKQTRKCEPCAYFWGWTLIPQMETGILWWTALRQIPFPLLSLHGSVYHSYISVKMENTPQKDSAISMIQINQIANNSRYIATYLHNGAPWGETSHHRKPIWAVLLALCGRYKGQEMQNAMICHDVILNQIHMIKTLYIEISW